MQKSDRSTASGAYSGDIKTVNFSVRQFPLLNSIDKLVGTRLHDNNSLHIHKYIVQFCS